MPDTTYTLTLTKNEIVALGFGVLTLGRAEPESPAWTAYLKIREALVL